MKHKLYQALCLLLTAALALNTGIIPVFAQTPCHQAHDATCGYSETTQPGICTHTHNDTCGYVAPEPEQLCSFIPSTESHGAPTTPAPHTHDDACGYAPATEGMPCTHAHDDTCIYSQSATAITPCAHTCELCANIDAPAQDEVLRDSVNAHQAPQVPIEMVCICPLEGGSTIHTESGCPFFGLDATISKSHSFGAVPTGVTVKETADYTYNIYANGNPIIIEKGTMSNAYGFIYIDSNNNGIVDSGELPAKLDGVYTDSRYPEAGYLLQYSSIYGGCESADLVGNTSVTMSSGLVRSLFGGGLTGDVSGTVNVNMTGGDGQVVNVLGASSGNTGDVYLKFSGNAFVQNVVVGGAQNGGTAGKTNIAITEDSWLNYVYGGAENGTTGDTTITISDNGWVQSVNGGGHGGNPGASAVSGNSTITVNNNGFYWLDGKTMKTGGWIYGGGYGAPSTTASSTINLNYDNLGKYQSYPMVCGAGYQGIVTGNSTINVLKNAPSTIYCGGYNGNTAGTTTVTVIADGSDGGAEYAINGTMGNGNANIGGESTVRYTNIGTVDNAKKVGYVQAVDNMVLTNSTVFFNGDSEKPVTHNLSVGSGSSLSIQGNPLHITGNFLGGGSIISEDSGVLSIDGNVSGLTTLDFQKRVPGSSTATEVRIVSAPNATTENFKLADGRTSDYVLKQSGGDWKAVKNTAVQLDITTSANLTYGETIQVKVTANNDDVTTAGKVKLVVQASTGTVSKIFEETKSLEADKSATFVVPIKTAGGRHAIQASFAEDAKVGQSEKIIEVAKRPLTISGIVVPDREYSTSTEVKIPASSFENAALSGYLSGDGGAVLHKRDYFAQLNGADLDVGTGKKISFAPNAQIFLDSADAEQREMLYKYYVPAPDDLTIDIKKQVVKGYYAPVPLEPITLGQSLSDVVLQTMNYVYEFRWLNPNTQPQMGNQTGYPILCTIKKEYDKNYEFDPTIKGYDSELKGIVTNVKVVVNARPVDPPTSPPPTNPPSQGDIFFKPQADKNKDTTFSMGDKQIADAIKKARAEAKRNGTSVVDIVVRIEVGGKALDSFTVNLPRSVQKTLIDEGVAAFTIDVGVSITFDLAALKHVYEVASGDVAVNASKVSSRDLSEKAIEVTGGRPVYKFTVSGGSKEIGEFGKGRISLGLRYERQKVDRAGKPNSGGSLEDASNLMGVYIEGSDPVYLPNSSYNTAGGMLLINTDHLSAYGVAYRQSPTFADTAKHWSKDDITFASARDLIEGSTDAEFDPDGVMTRGMFIKALTTLSGKDMTKIVGGKASATVNREEMAVIMQSYTKAMGYKLPSVHKRITFTDSAKISESAKPAVEQMQTAGVLMGKDKGKFDPKGKATKAQAAAMLHRYVELLGYKPAKGWYVNDSGNRMYFKNAKPLTGKMKIGGKPYKFDQYGVTPGQSK